VAEDFLRLWPIYSSRLSSFTILSPTSLEDARPEIEIHDLSEAFVDVSRRLHKLAPFVRQNLGQ